jgi:hypothetical protein
MHFFQQLRAEGFSLEEFVFCPPKLGFIGLISACAQRDLPLACPLSPPPIAHTHTHTWTRLCPQKDDSSRINWQQLLCPRTREREERARKSRKEATAEIRRRKKEPRRREEKDGLKIAHFASLTQQVDGEIKIRTSSTYKGGSMAQFTYPL